MLMMRVGNTVFGVFLIYGPNCVFVSPHIHMTVSINKTRNWYAHLMHFLANA